MKKNVLILFGGNSCEHDISIISTFQCLKHFSEYLYNVILVYIDKSGVWKLVTTKDIKKFLFDKDRYKKVQLGVNDNVLYLQKGKNYKTFKNVDVVFPILHGVNGEDGCIAGLLKMSNICYVGSDNVSSVVGIDKSIFKKVCVDLPIIKSIMISDDELKNEDNVVKKISSSVGYPCIIKPVKLGSSIGINLCENSKNLIELTKNSFKFDKKVIVEPYIKELREFNVALFKQENNYVLSEIEEPILKDNILSFNDKYLNFSNQLTTKNIPAKINSALRKKIEENAKKCYDLLGCSGIVRVDFIYDTNAKNLYINEVNTIPGSLALYLFEAKDIEKNQVIDKVIHEAMRQFYKKDIETNYDSKVLVNQDFNKFQNKYK